MSHLVTIAAAATAPVWWPVMLAIEVVQVVYFPRTTPLGVWAYERLTR
jgi:hypothetical protein